MNALISSNHVRPVRWAVMLGAWLVLTGCNRDSPPPWPVDPPPSEQFEPVLRAGYERMARPPAGDPAVIADLETYDSIKQGLYGMDTAAAATHELHTLWSKTPDHVLWPNLARAMNLRLTDPELVYSTFSAPVCTDSSTAIGAYMQAWQEPRLADIARNLELARTRSAELAPFPRFWIELKSGLGARFVNSPEVSAERALGLLPTARDLGGAGLESRVWLELAWAKFRLGEYDDALQAAVIADTLATLAVPEGGAIAGVLEIRRLRADILAARRHAHEAMQLYKSNIDQATELGLGFLLSGNLNRAGTLADAMGDPGLALDFDLRGLQLVIAEADSLHIPPHLVNIATGYRLTGQLDSCRAYLSRAEECVAAHPHPRNVARMPLFQAEYYLHIGAYDVAESLLTTAEQLSRNSESSEELAEFYIEMIQGWMQAGRPDVVYRLIESASGFRSQFADTHADRNVSADLNLLIGEFYTRRNQFALAEESLNLAAAAIGEREDPEKEWALARNRGRLDLARRNFRGADRWFLECVRIGEQLGYPDHEATGRLLAGSARLERGDFASAREILPPPALESSLDNRILALMLTGVSHLREGHAELALGFLHEARAACRAWTPLHLIGRVELETGRAHAHAGDAAAAIEQYEVVASRIHDLDFELGITEELAYFTGDLRRDLVEARLAIEPVDARTSLSFATDLLPRWTSPDAELSTPQVVYFVGESLSGRWILDASGVHWKRLPGSDEITESLEPALADLGSPDAPIGATGLAALSEMLLGDLDNSWPADQTLQIVPDLALSRVPWAALTLPGTAQTVIEHGSFVVLDQPATDDARARSIGDRLLVIAADSGGASGLEQLRNAGKEAEEVGASWAAGKADLRIGSSAAGSLGPDRDLSAYRAIHIASHARVYSGRPDQTTLLLDANSATASHIRDLRVAADLVFLSACEAGEGGEVRSVHAGLARSFQDAGARQVIAPIAAIDDAAARELAVSFYNHWTTGASVADALRAAQLEQLSGERSHPFYWAFYQVFGGAGR